jgi:acyl carrier protein
VDRIVHEVFCDVLGIDQLPLDVSFFDMGGVSIEAAQISLRISSALDMELDAADIMAHETLGQLLQLVRARLAHG